MVQRRFPADDSRIENFDRRGWRVRRLAPADRTPADRTHDAERHDAAQHVGVPFPLGVGDQASGAIPGDVIPEPLKHDEDSILKTGEIQNVDEQPRQPSDTTGQSPITRLHHSARSPDRRHIAFVPILKRSVQANPRDRFADSMSDVLPLLHGDRCHTGKRLAIGGGECRHITGRKDVREFRDGAVCIDRDAPCAIQERRVACSLRQELRQRRCLDSCCPDHVLGCYGDRFPVATNHDIFGMNILESGLIPDFRAEALQRLVRALREGRVIFIENQAAILHQQHACRGGVDRSKIVLQREACQFANRACHLDPGRPPAHDHKGEESRPSGWIGFFLGFLECSEQRCPYPSRIFDRLQSGREPFPAGIVSEVMVGRSGGDNQVIVLDRAFRLKQNMLFGEIKPDGRVHQDLYVPLSSKDAAQGRRNICRGESSGGYLVQQGLEQMEIPLIDQFDIRTRSRESTRAGHADETATKDEHSRQTRNHHACDRVRSCADATSNRTVVLGCCRRIEAGSRLVSGPLIAARTASALRASGTLHTIRRARRISRMVMLMARLGTSSRDANQPSPTCCRRHASSNGTT